jgi:p24 family protein delta-1
VQVQDPKGKVLFTKSSSIESQFAFTSTMAGDYRACFSVEDMDTAMATTIRLDWKTGVAATNWDDIAKKENLDLMATELRKLEQVVKEIHEEMLYFRTREEEMRNLNGAILIPASAAPFLRVVHLSNTCRWTDGCW